MIKLDLNPDARALAQFAWIAVLGLPLLAWTVVRLCHAGGLDHPAVLIALGIGLLQLGAYLAGIRAPSRWLFVGLSALVFPIGFVVSHVLMAAIYYLMFTPIGLVQRLLGRDAMQRRLDRSASSYWQARATTRDPTSYFKLY